MNDQCAVLDATQLVGRTPEARATTKLDASSTQRKSVSKLYLISNFANVILF